MSYLVAACNQIIDPDWEVFGLFKAGAASPVYDLQAEQLVLAVHILRVIVVNDSARLRLCLTGKRFRCTSHLHQPSLGKLCV